MKKNDGSFAGMIGKTAAHLQHGIDRVIEWGFRSMRGVNDAPAKPGATGRAAYVLRTVVRFFGAAGDTYYRTYEELKRKK